MLAVNAKLVTRRFHTRRAQQTVDGQTVVRSISSLVLSAHGRSASRATRIQHHYAKLCPGFAIGKACRVGFQRGRSQYEVTAMIPPRMYGKVPLRLRSLELLSISLVLHNDVFMEF